MAIAFHPMRTMAPSSGVSQVAGRGGWIRLAAVVLALALAGVGGCASTGESDLPWNQPQAWEGAPSIPGFTPGGR